MSEWSELVLGKMTLDEKISMLAGLDYWHTVPVERLEIPSLRMTDGPNGARGVDPNHGATSTSFPVGAAMGATFDLDLIGEVGRALAVETRAKGADVLLGPTVNIPRVPVAGRNFECFSEDPVLSGLLAASYIAGVQQQGVAACIKHFVCNDQEYQRSSIDANVDRRTLHEIYLEPFRIAVQQSQPWAAMSAYNTINGITASENPLLNDVLRGEFGFDGLIMSDWFGTYSPAVAGSGLDIEMPGPARWMSAEHVNQALADGVVDHATIDEKVGRILELLDRTGARHRPQPEPEKAIEPAAHRELARKVAVESLVLLKNESVLPLATPPRIAVLGPLAKNTPCQGGGSSKVNPHRIVSILQGIEGAAPDGSTVTWAQGAIVHRKPPEIDRYRLAHPTADSDPQPGFKAEYFTTTDLSGDPVRTVSTVGSNLYFRGDHWVDSTRFSLRLSGTYLPDASGPHVFSANVVGNLRVMADGEVVLDSASDDPAAELQWELNLVDGTGVDLVIDYVSIAEQSSRVDDAEPSLNIRLEPPQPADHVAQASALAAESDVAVVVVGMTYEWESEGFDRADLALPGDQVELIEAVAAVQPNLVVVTVGGSAIEMPWLDRVGAVLHTWYGGQEIGVAVADVLFGNEDPGGRLPVTFPRDSKQHPGLLNYPGQAGKVRYGEGVYVAYRGYDRLGLTPAFAFGHGLSYTTFELSDLQATETPPGHPGAGAGAGDPGHPGQGGIVVSARLTNTGERSGTEVVQVYARNIGSVDRKLVAFAKLKPGSGESVEVTVPVDRARLQWWNPEVSGWVDPTGPIELVVRGTFGEHLVTVGQPAS